MGGNRSKRKRVSRVRVRRAVVSFAAFPLAVRPVSGAGSDFGGSGLGGTRERLDLDWFYGGAAGRDPYASRWGDHFGSGNNPYDYGGYGGHDSWLKKDPVKPEDECARLESGGVSLAAALREAADAIGEEPFFEATPQIQRLIHFVADLKNEKHKALVLAACPQAVALALLLRVQGNTTDNEVNGLNVAIDLGEMLASIPSVRDENKPALEWSGEPWESVLGLAQQRSGVVMFPIGDNQFHTEYISPKNWVIHPRRRCAGRRDLGNLQSTPLEMCLEKCQAHPFCRSATFWRWQPGGYGFEKRCFLSSSCTNTIATSDGSEGAVLFEKRTMASTAEDAMIRRSVVTPREGAPWAPRCGHGLVTGKPSVPGGLPVFWLFGGIGVDAYANTSKADWPETEVDVAQGKSRVSSAPDERYGGYDQGGFSWPGHTWDAPRNKKSKKSKGDHGKEKQNDKDSHEKTKKTQSSKGSPEQMEELSNREKVEPAKAKAVSKAKPRARAKAKVNNTTTGSNAIKAYLSRHVELSGELPPLRSLSYGRLGDVWRSDDLGATWSMVSQSTPWGQRAFFGAIAVNNGAALLVVGGVRQPDDTKDPTAGNIYIGGPLPRQYANDVWWGNAVNDGAGISWTRLPNAPWKPRASFQLLNRHEGEENEEVVLLGGRLENGRYLNAVWSARIGQDMTVTWQIVAKSVAWEPRADFAAVARGTNDFWLAGGCGKQGRALSDVWRSSDVSNWILVTAAAPWGPRIGTSLVAFAADPGGDVPGMLAVFGGYAYADSGFDAVPASTHARAVKPATWISSDGSRWEPLQGPHMAWIPNRMHTTLGIAPCRDAGDNKSGADFVLTTCAYAIGGVTNEGYYDNSVHRLTIPLHVPAAAPNSDDNPNQASFPAQPDEINEFVGEADATLWGRIIQMPPVVGAFICASGAALLVGIFAFSIFAANGHSEHTACINGSAAPGKPMQTNGAVKIRQRRSPLDPAISLVLVGFSFFIVVFAFGAGFGATAWLQLSEEVRAMRHGAASSCQVDNSTIAVLSTALGLSQLTARWDQLQTLLRVASKETSLGLGYGALGGYGRTSDPYGSGRDRHGYDYLADAYSGEESSDAAGQKTNQATLVKELRLLPTTQGLSCRSPRCDRNATTCAPGQPRSWESPHGCCSDYMMIILTDVTGWLREQGIPYFITYSTLLGALREGDMLSWTQDADIVVDRTYWPQLQRGLENADFFGGRKYLFSVDQWEERVSRVCADWEGFASSTIGGESDRYTRTNEFHLDVYASDWWQITEMHLIDCVEPLGTMEVPIRGINFSAPARPRACLEKLYGAEWRTPKQALAGIN